MELDVGDGRRLRVTGIRSAPDVVVVEFHGELDLATEPGARAELAARTRDRPRHLVLDLSGLALLASHGLRLLVAAHRNEDAIHGRLHLVADLGNRHVRRVLAFTGLDAELALHPDRARLLAELATAH